MSYTWNKSIKLAQQIVKSEPLYALSPILLSLSIPHHHAKSSQRKICCQGCFSNVLVLEIQVTIKKPNFVELFSRKFSFT